MAARASDAAFYLPPDPETLLVLIAAGAGLAPVLGFLQERACQALAGRTVTKSVLFFECRRPGEDFLYPNSDEHGDLKRWVKLGVVDIRPALSKVDEGFVGV